MMIGIVIPLKAKSISQNWEVTCKNLGMTLNSIDSQTCDLFTAMVVGHDQPEYFDHPDPSRKKSKFIYFDEASPPQKGPDESQNQLNYEKDRCSKILKGVKTLKKKHSEITHWFALDADDVIHKDFVKVLQKYDPADNVVLDNGYFYYKSTGIINMEDEFSAYCGSSSVLSDDLFKISSEVNSVNFRSIPFGAVSHVHMRKYLIGKGFKVFVPKDRLIMYVRENGENISNAAYCNTVYGKFKRFAKMILRYKFLSKELKSNFGIV